MFNVSIIYPNTAGSRLDLDYYLYQHMPMTLEKLSPALKRVSVEHGLGGAFPGTAPEFAAICHLYFDSVEAFLTAFGPHAAELQGDIPNYTDVRPIIQYSEVKIAQSS
jgi:uncharacterized protein (TIGR02118 family)